MARRHYRSLVAMMKHVGSMGEIMLVVHNAVVLNKEPLVLYLNVSALDEFKGVE